MHPVRQLFVALIMLGGLAAIPVHAETFHTCGTIIASVPTVITTAGLYCLSHDLNTAITSGKAIDIQTNNVTLDCNGYKIGGLAAGTFSQTFGIFADGRQNITIRNCGIRGFLFGIHLDNGSGNLVEDNRLDNNLFVAMYVFGDNNRVRRNAIYDTGGNHIFAQSIALSTSANVIDNTIAGVFDVGTNPFNAGIILYGSNTEARGNQVSGILTAGTGQAVGIQVNATGITVRDNSISEPSLTNGQGIGGHGVTDTICIGNSVFKFSTPILTCQDGGGNASN